MAGTIVAAGTIGWPGGYQLLLGTTGKKVILRNPPSKRVGLPLGAVGPLGPSWSTATEREGEKESWADPRERERGGFSLFFWFYFTFQNSNSNIF
jgi:hypothetical protein